jgi:hypothetical protein
MLNPKIRIWKECDQRVRRALCRFERRWRPSSSEKHTVRLIEELIDSALHTYSEELPRNRVNYIPGAGAGVSFSSILRQYSFEKTLRIQRYQLRAFGSFKNTKDPIDKTLESTLETLIGLTDACLRKTVQRVIIPETPLRNGRQQGFWEHGFCKFCGNLAEYTAVSKGNLKIDFHPPKANGESKTLRLSTGYCGKHRPLQHDNTWSLEYQKAKRSAAQFQVELLRLTRQSRALHLGLTQSGDKLIDAYIYLDVLKHGFRSGDEAELRNHARLLVDNKLTDQKKKMVILRFLGLSLQAIAPLVGVKSRQAVFKALGSIKSEFLELPIPASFSRNFEYP